MNRMETSAALVADRIDRVVEGVQSWLDGIRATLQFPLGWMTRPTEVASLVPSSKSLLRQLTRSVKQQRPRSVVELGPGTGNTSQALLTGLDADAKLMAIEIVPEFVEQLQAIDDTRMIAVEGDATELQELVGSHGRQDVDMIVSGIPFSTMDASAAKELVRTIHDVLSPGGVFLAYQLRDTVSEYAGEVFANDSSISFVWWNLPPLRLYCWTKNSAAASDRGERESVTLHALPA